MKILVSAIALTFSSISFAADTTAKEKAIDEYFQIMSIKDVHQEMIQEITKNMPPEKKKFFTEALNSNFDFQRVESAAKQSLAKHLTLVEIQVFVEFMKRPAAQSAMKKMKYYMADLMPVMQDEIKKAIGRAQAKTK